MKYALLIALREFLENARTKGFWIGIFMLPFILAVSIAVSVMLATSSPTRHFALVDQSGEFGNVIEQAVDRAHQSSVLQALNRYAAEYARPPGPNLPDQSSLPEAQTQPPDAQYATGSAQAVERFIAAGGAGAYLQRLRPALRDDAPEFVEPQRRFVRLDLPPGVDPDAETETLTQQLRPYLNGDRRATTGDGRPTRLFAAIVIAPNALDAVTGPDNLPAAGTAGTGPVQYWSRNLSDRGLANLIGEALNDEVRDRAYVARGVSLATVQQVEQTRIGFGSFDPGKEAGEETVDIADALLNGAPIAFVYLLWISLFIVVQMLLNNTIEEKSNRIIEVLLSSVTPGELMMGKLIGIAGVGLAMVGTWLVTLFAGMSLYQGDGSEVVGQVLEAVAGSGLMATFLVYFAFGYLLYAGIFLSVGSLCNSLKEAQNLQGPMMLIMMVPLLTMVFINRDPHGTLAVVMTWIPLYTPFTMMNRVAADPPLFDLVGSMVLMIAATALILWLSGRIFRIGILRTGQRPRLVEVLRWLRRTADA